MIGSIRWFDKDRHFGFIEMEDGREIFFHRDSVLEYQPNMSLKGEVEFEIAPGRNGRNQAVNVVIVDSNVSSIPTQPVRPFGSLATGVKMPAAPRRKLPSDLDDLTLQEVLGINRTDRPARKTKKSKANRT